MVNYFFLLAIFLGDISARPSRYHLYDDEVWHENCLKIGPHCQVITVFGYALCDNAPKEKEWVRSDR